MTDEVKEVVEDVKQEVKEEVQEAKTGWQKAMAITEVRMLLYVIPVALIALLLALILR